MVLGHNFADPRDKTMYADNRSQSPQKKKYYKYQSTAEAVIV